MTYPDDDLFPYTHPAGREWAGRFYEKFMAMGYGNNTAVVLANHAVSVIRPLIDGGTKPAPGEKA